MISFSDTCEFCRLLAAMDAKTWSVSIAAVHDKGRKQVDLIVQTEDFVSNSNSLVLCFVVFNGTLVRRHKRAVGRVLIIGFL